MLRVRKWKECIAKGGQNWQLTERTNHELVGVKMNRGDAVIEEHPYAIDYCGEGAFVEDRLYDIIAI
jgi:hypothetical protein